MGSCSSRPKLTLKFPYISFVFLTQEVDDVANLEESRPDQVESLLASVCKQEEQDCIFQLCGLQKIQVEGFHVQISVVPLLPHTTGTPHPHWLCPSDHSSLGYMQKVASIWAQTLLCCSVVPILMLEELVGLQGTKANFFLLAYPVLLCCLAREPVPCL